MQSKFSIGELVLVKDVNHLGEIVRSMLLSSGIWHKVVFVNLQFQWMNYSDFSEDELESKENLRAFL